MRWLYLILICFAAPVAALLAGWRGLRDPSRRERLADRFGKPDVVPGEPTIWVHAASVGEVQAGAVLVKRLLDRYPSYRVVMTTMTGTGAARVKALFPQRVIHCYVPYDLPCAVQGFVQRVQPKLAVILETELWPNLLRACAAKQIPVLIASARISLRTAGHYRRLAGLFRPVLRHVVVAAQTEADAERFRQLGAAHVEVAGNLKFDMDIPDSVRRTGSAWRRDFGTRFVWVAGSTHEGEEQMALAAHRQLLQTSPNALLILVPRHPQRFDRVRSLLADGGLPWVSRANGLPVGPNVAILLLDTMGELLAAYAAADLAFVGGSLVAVGGHNLLEPAALALPVLCGPHTNNTAEIAHLMLEQGAARQVASGQALAEVLVTLSADPVSRAGMAASAQRVVAHNAGSVARIETALSRLLPRVNF
jgi:3-deoxy-D-manno-octulosonic-acid transferase